jgi:hypothetical protein
MDLPPSGQELLGNHTRREFRARMQSGQLQASLFPWPPRSSIWNTWPWSTTGAA